MNIKEWINKFLGKDQPTINLPENSEGLGDIVEYNPLEETELWSQNIRKDLANAKLRYNKSLLKNRERAQEYAARTASTRKEAEQAIKEFGDIPPVEEGEFPMSGRNLTDIYQDLGDVTKDSFLTQEQLPYLSEEAEARTAKLLDELRGESGKYAVLTPNRTAVAKELSGKESELEPLLRQLLGEENQFVLPQHLEQLESFAKEKGVPFSYKDYPNIDREMKMLGSDSLFFDRPVLSKILDKMPADERIPVSDALLDIAKKNKFNNLDEVINHIDKNPNKFSRQLGGIYERPNITRGLINDLRRGAGDLSDAERLNWRYLDMQGLENIEHRPLEQVLKDLRKMRGEENAPLGVLNENLGFGESSLNSDAEGEGVNFNESFSDIGDEFHSASDAETEYFDAIENLEEPAVRNPERAIANQGEEIRAGEAVGGVRNIAQKESGLAKGLKAGGKAFEVLQVADLAKEGAALGRNYREQIEDKGMLPGLWQGAQDSMQHGAYTLAEILDANADFAADWQPINWFRPEEGYTSLVGNDPIPQRFESNGMSDDIQNYGKGFVNDVQYALTGQANMFNENYIPNNNENVLLPAPADEPNLSGDNVEQQKKKRMNNPMPQMQPLKDILISPSSGAGQGIARTSSFRF